jgi:hypothetical protein
LPLQGGIRSLPTVCRGGSGGGTKGASIIDKRKQEFPCPHCDRTFQQKDRFRAHLESKHAEEEAAAAADASSAAASAGAAAADAAAPSTSGTDSGGGAKAGGMMKAGAKAGLYTSKAPVVLLQDQCRSDGRVKPRIKPQVRRLHTPPVIAVACASDYHEHRMRLALRPRCESTVLPALEVSGHEARNVGHRSACQT